LMWTSIASHSALGGLKMRRTVIWALVGRGYR